MSHNEPHVPSIAEVEQPDFAARGIGQPALSAQEPAIAIIDQHCRLRFANAGVERLFASAPGGLLGRHFLDLLGPEMREAARADVERMALGEPVECVFVAARDDGTTANLHIDATPLERSGECCRSILILRDVRAEHEDAVQRERRRRIQDIAAAAGRVAVRTQSTRRLLDALCTASVGPGGYSAASVVAVPEDDSRPPVLLACAGMSRSDGRAVADGFSDNRRPFHAMFSNGVLVREPDECADDEPKVASALRAVVSLGNHGGRRLLLVLVASPDSKFYSEEIRALGALAQDVGVSLRLMHQDRRRRAAERALLRSERMLRVVFDESPIGLGLFDKGDSVRDINPAFARILGVTEADALTPFLDNYRLFQLPELRQRETARLDMELDFDMLRADLGLVTTRSGRVTLEISITVIETDDGRDLYLVQIQDITERREAERQRLEHELQLRALAGQLERAEQRERRRLAEDLHDGVGQTLAVAKMKLHELDDQMWGSTPESLVQALALVERAIQDVRSLTTDLSPPMLYELGLVPALEWLSTSMWNEHVLRVDVAAEENLALTDDLRALLYRSARELLMNVVKHAEARRVTVTLTTEHEWLVLSVEDDGVGCDPHAVSGGFGLFSIRERLAAFGGSVRISSVEGTGTCVSLWLRRNASLAEPGGVRWAYE